MDSLVKLLPLCALCLAISCSDTNNNTGILRGAPPDTLGGEPAPSSNKVDLGKTQVDSLRHTPDISTDTPAAAKPNEQTE